MTTAHYVELHCHSNFSFLDGASHPEQLIARAAELDYPALAITDHNGLYGIVRFSQAALQKGIKPIFGAEITLDNDSHLLLLVKDNIGYANLSQLLSRAQLDNEKGNARATYDMLDTYHNGLIALSGCQLGEVPKALLQEDYKSAEIIASRYHELFGQDNFYLELQHHNLPTHEILCEQLIRLGKNLNLPLVATNNVHYAHPENRPLQDVLTCIKGHTTLDKANDLLYPNAERCLKSAEQMARRFKHVPE
ncbi:MAG: PHP domain-containing protein, partial [Candidatus Zixiibacteriota bacterium]